MDARRIYQTTLLHPLRPEFSVAALFLGARFADASGAEALCRSLAIEPLSGGEISAQELRRVLACLLTDSLEVFDMTPPAFLNYVNASGIDQSFMEHALSEAHLVIARGGATDGPATLASQTLDGLLADSLAAGFGFYTLSERDRLHEISGRHQIELLFLILREGLVLVGSQRGLDRALHLGLYERLHQTFIAPQLVVAR